MLLLDGFAFDARWSTALFTSLIVGVFILSLVVLTGYAGQLSLAQYAIGGLCALFASRLVADEHWPAELAFLAGVAFAIVVGVLFAIPALRTRGVNLAVVTLGMGFAVQQMIFGNEYFTGNFGSVTEIGRIHVFGWDVNAAAHPERYFVVCLGIFVLSSLMVANLRRSGTGLRLIAVRNNERAAASLGISVFGAKLYAFAVGAAHRLRSRGSCSRSRTRPSSTAASRRSNRSTWSATRSSAASAGCSARCSAAPWRRVVSARSSSTGSTSAPGSSRSAASCSS